MAKKKAQGQPRKKKWHVYGVVIGTKHLGTFEAATKEEAEEMAMNGESMYVALCHQCAREMDDPEIQEVKAEEVPDGETSED